MPQTIFSGALGLNTKFDPVTLRAPSREGYRWLVNAVNVDVTNTHRVASRPLFTTTDITSSCHSLFCDGGDALVVSGSVLYKLNNAVQGSNDFTLTSIRTGLTEGATMRYVQVANKIYYTNGYENGVYSDGSSSSWEAPTYVGPSTTRTFTDPPVGHLLEYCASRIWIGVGSTLVCTEKMRYNEVNLAENEIRFPSRLKMITAPGDDGLFVSDSHNIYYVQAPQPTELAGIVVKHLNRELIADFPAIDSQNIKTDSRQLGIEGLPQGRVSIFGSKEGLCVCGKGGSLHNLTIDVLNCPDADYGSGITINNKLIYSFEP